MIFITHLAPEFVSRSARLLMAFDCPRALASGAKWSGGVIRWFGAVKLTAYLNLFGCLIMALGHRIGWRGIVVATALSAPSAAGATQAWSASLTIQSFIPTDNGLKMIVSGNNNTLGCGIPSWIGIRMSDTNFGLISATMLTAFAQGKTVKIWSDSCDTDGSVRFVAAWIDS